MLPRRLLGAIAAIVLALTLAGAPVRADDPAPTDESLRSRIAELTEAAERAGATELLGHASRALLTSDRLRHQGDEAGATRAHAIAAAAVIAAERRVFAHRARGDREAARARLAELEARARTAAEALTRARAERARLSVAEAPPPPSAEAAPEGE